MNSNSEDLVVTALPFNKRQGFFCRPSSMVSESKFQARWSWDDSVNEELADKITGNFSICQVV